MATRKRSSAKKSPAPENRIASHKQTSTTSDSGDGDGNGSAFGALRTASTVAAMLGTRAAVAAYLGKSYGGDRDLYTALGYKKDPLFNDYMARYLRQDIAKAVVDVPVRASWRKPPEISESEEDETDFEKAWSEMATRLRLWHYFSRVDRLASIGEYAILLLGFDDAAQLSEPVTKASRVLYVMPYSQENARVRSYVSDATDERFSLPETYSVQIRTQSGGTSSRLRTVHWSRVIHVSEDNLEDDVLGLPRLQSVLNRLQDLELVSGSSAEMFYRGAFPGLNIKVDKDHQLGVQDETALEAEMEEYLHDFRRYLRLEGMTIEAIEQQIVNPEKQADLFITLISVASRIPKRILQGSEMGELASSQDEINWWGRIDERRREHCEPTIVRQVIDRCISVGALPKPAEGYDCLWPDLLTPSAKDKAEVAKTLSEAMAKYVSSGADAYMPPAFYFEHVLGFSRELIDKLNDMLETMQHDADGDGDNDATPQSDDDLPEEET